MNLKMLKKIMIKKGISSRVLSEKTGICRLILYLRISGCAEFTLEEIGRISKALNLTKEEIGQIFFDKKVS